MDIKDYLEQFVDTQTANGVDRVAMEKIYIAGWTDLLSEILVDVQTMIDSITRQINDTTNTTLLSNYQAQIDILRTFRHKYVNQFDR